jgi:hypothetical protein
VGSVFSAISGQIGKTFAIGALLPSTVFVLLAQLFIAPMAPLELRALPIIRSIDSQWQLGLVVALSTILATLLYVMNNSILRFYEGYPWHAGPLGEWLTDRRKAELDRLAAGQNKIKPLILPLVGDETNETAFKTLNARYMSLTLPLLCEFPKRASVLPTRLGNVIRSFENYPERQYSIAAITLWPRFVPKLSKEHAAVIDEAKSGVDLLLNLSCLAYVSFLTTLALGVAFPIPFASTRLLGLWLLRMGVFASLGYGFYRASVPLAKRWGESVRAAFDLHRAAVLRDLGFEQKPETLEAERDLWNSISQQLVYGEVVTTEAWRYRGRVSVQPADAHLTLSRGVAIENGVRTVFVEIRNDGDQPVSNVTINEELEAGHEYLWATGSVGATKFTPSGSNPLVFRVAQVAAGEATVITYQTTMPKK